MLPTAALGTALPIDGAHKGATRSMPFETYEVDGPNTGPLGAVDVPNAGPLDARRHSRRVFVIAVHDAASMKAAATCGTMALP